MILANTLLVAAVAGSVLQVAMARLVARFAALPGPRPTTRPFVTILKPLYGVEPGLLDNLRSLWRQDWADLRLVCGIADMGDPAVETVRRLQAEFPEGDIRLVVGDPSRAPNSRAALLEDMLPQSGEGIVAIAGKGVDAPSDLVSALVAALEGRKTGLAICLPTTQDGGDTCSRLAAMGGNHGVLPLTLLGWVLGRKDVFSAAVLALPRTVLDNIGGFAPLADRPHDGHALAQQVRRLGLDIALAPHLVHTRMHERTFTGLLAHEIRQGRIAATLAPFAYGATLLAQPVILALLGNLAAGFAGKTPLVLAAALMVRMLTARVIDAALETRSAPLWLLPLRDGLSAIAFVASWCGRWRPRPRK